MSNIITPPPFEIHRPSTPKHLKITPTMRDDFLIDPVLGARVLMNVHLDVFQAVRLKLAWWYPWFMDCSGLGTGKTLGMFLKIMLRCLLYEGQVVCVYYQTYDAGKRIFWKLFRDYKDPRDCPLFCAQLGKVDIIGDKEGKGNTKDAASSTQWFKNESRVLMPAPNWVQEAVSQAGDTFNGAAIDEWTKIQAMTKKGETVSGIDKQVLGRVRGKSFNQYHRLWTNFRYFSATADAPSSPGYERYAAFKKRMDAGDPDYYVFTSSFKDFSNRKSKNGRPFKDVVPDWKMIEGNKKQWTKAHFLREALGLWARETKGWYAEDRLARCVELGAASGLEVECTRGQHAEAHYFLGIDSAPSQTDKSDDGGLAILRARANPALGRPATNNPGDWLLEWVWAYRVRGNLKRMLKDEQQGALFARTMAHWAGLVHTAHIRFALSGLMLDPGAGGGGGYLYAELEKSRQLINGAEQEVMPLASPLESMGGNANFIVRMFRRKDFQELWPVLKGDDNLIHAAHLAYQESIERGAIWWPLPFNERPKEQTEGWPIEQQWALKNLDAMRTQLQNIAVETFDDGKWRPTGNGALSFAAARGKKDLAYAGLFAFCRFLIWLRLGGADEEQNGDEAGFGVSSYGG
jgi:hypothetical protein